MYCVPLSARHTQQDLYCFSEKLTVFVESTGTSMAGVAQMVVCRLVTPCRMSLLRYFGVKFCLRLQDGNFYEIIVLRSSGWPQYLKPFYTGSMFPSPNYLSSHLNQILSPCRCTARPSPKRRNRFIVYYVKNLGNRRWNVKFFRLPREDAATSPTFLFNGQI